MNSATARYGASVLLIVVLLLVRLALQPWLGLSVPYLQFFPAVILAARLGLGPGLLPHALGLGELP